MRTFFQKNSGVTLIELVVVISILSIMAGIATVSFSSSRDKRAVETNAREFSAVLRLAQNYTLNGKQSATGTCGYGIASSINSAYYISIYTRFVGGGCLPSGQALGGGGQYNLKQGVTFSTSDSSVPIYFQMPKGIPNVQMNFTFSKNGSNYYVCVNTEGEIRESATLNCQ